MKRNKKRNEDGTEGRRWFPVQVFSSFSCVSLNQYLGDFSFLSFPFLP